MARIMPANHVFTAIAWVVAGTLVSNAPLAWSVTMARTQRVLSNLDVYYWQWPHSRHRFEAGEQTYYSHSHGYKHSPRSACNLHSISGSESPSRLGRPRNMRAEEKRAFRWRGPFSMDRLLGEGIYLYISLDESWATSLTPPRMPTA